jgi:hypothetical protein
VLTADSVTDCVMRRDALPVARVFISTQFSKARNRFFDLMEKSRDPPKREAEAAVAGAVAPGFISFFF